MTPKMLKIIPCVLVLAIAITGCSDSTNPLGREALDTVPPAAPANVVLTARTAQPSLTLNWDSNAEADLAGYVIHRSFDEGDTWTAITPVLTTTEFVDGYHTQASYRVTALDLAENESAASSLVSYHAPTDGPKIPADEAGLQL